jgi:hypothetical protein
MKIISDKKLKILEVKFGQNGIKKILKILSLIFASLLHQKKMF